MTVFLKPKLERGMADMIGRQGRARAGRPDSQRGQGGEGNSELREGVAKQVIFISMMADIVADEILEPEIKDGMRRHEKESGNDGGRRCR